MGPVKSLAFRRRRRRVKLVLNLHEMAGVPEGQDLRVGERLKKGKSMNDLMRHSLTGAAVCALVAPAAFGQGADYYSRDKYVAVSERPQPEFDPEPVRLGAFLVRSAAELDVSHSDNIFVLSDNEESGTIASLGARVSGTTTWSVHSLGFDILARRNEYLDQGDESNDELRAGLRGRLDISRSLSLGGNVFAEERVEARTDTTNAFSADKPIGVSVQGAGLDLNYVNDRVRWTNQLSLRNEDFEDGRQVLTGSAIDQDYRDRLVTRGRTRLAYAISPDLAVFGQAAYEERSYDGTQVLAGAERSRDSEGYALAAGVDFELQALVRGDVAVGYLNEDKADSFFEDVSGLSFDGRLEWFPTQLTTLTFNGSRQVVDIGLIDAPTAVERRLGVRVDHELLRNVLLTARVGSVSHDFEEIDRSDDRIELGAGATYKLNRNVHLNAFLDYADRDSSGADTSPDRSYKVTTVGAGIRVFP